MNIYKEVLKAEERIRKFIKTTPLIHSQYFSTIVKNPVYLKDESSQVTGSFKARGALNKILSLPKSTKFVITASTGNHGKGVANAAKLSNIEVVVFLPENAAKNKIKTLKKLGVTLKFYGIDSVDTEIYARNYAKKNDGVFISPYNDTDVLAGQGTVGVELYKKLQKIDYVLVPIGGGGLITGIAGYLKKIIPTVKVIGCLPLNSPVLYKSVKRNKIVSLKSKPTLSDGTAGGLEPKSITFELCKKLVDDYILVSEKEIEKAIFLLHQKENLTIEGAGALPIAALMQESKILKGNIICVLSGGNIAPDTMKAILTKYND